MTGLEALITPTGPVPEYRTAKVLSVSGRSLTVDMGGPIVVPSLNSCNPQPGQSVGVLIYGPASMVAVGVAGGAYKQATLTATASTTTTVTGVLNGSSTVVPKIGAFTVTNGDVLPLMWSADGSGVWVLAQPGSAYVPPDSSGGGGSTPPSGGGGTSGGTSTYTSTYYATASGTHLTSDISGNLNFNTTFFLTSGAYGYFRYGLGRMRELRNRTLISGRIYLPRLSGSGSVNLSVTGNPGSNLTSTGGWAALGFSRVVELVNVPSIAQTQVQLVASSVGALKGVPAGTIQITWK